MPARIIRLAANITSVKGSNSSFECKASGDRPISVGWSVGQKAGDWTKERRSFVFISLFIFSSLVFSSVTIQFMTVLYQIIGIIGCIYVQLFEFLLAVHKTTG